MFFSGLDSRHESDSVLAHSGLLLDVSLPRFFNASAASATDLRRLRLYSLNTFTFEIVYLEKQMSLLHFDWVLLSF